MTSSHSNIASSDGIEVRLIVGMSRAGTTSMVSLLNSRGDCAAFGETGFWGQAEAQKDGPLSGEDKAALAQRYGRVYMTSLKEDNQLRLDKDVVRQTIAKTILQSADTSTARDVFTNIGQAIAGLSDRPYWAEKTPYHLMHLPRILSQYPSARVIICLRSPDSFMLSYKHQGDRKMERVRKTFQSLYHPALAALIARGYLRKAESALAEYPDNVCLIRLEDTKKNPAQTIQTVFKHLQLPPSNVSVFPQTNSSFSQSPDLHPTLSAADLFWLKIITRKSSAALGYTLPKVKGGFLDIIKSCFALCIWPLRNLKRLRNSRLNVWILIKRWLSH